MKIQMHNEISNAIGLDRDLEFDLEVVEVDSKERNWRNDKKELKNYVFPFRMIMRKFHTIMRNGPKGICVANQREISKLISHDHVKISHSHAKLLELVRKCWISLEMDILLLNSIFLGEKAFRRPLRWCQVSTWPWPLNRNLIYSF